MSAPNVRLMLSDHARDAITDAQKQLGEAAERLASIATELAALMAHDALQRALTPTPTITKKEQA